MKKIKTLLLIAILSFATAFPVLAASNNDGKSVAESNKPEFAVVNTSGEIGDIAEVKILLNNNPGIAALQLDIEYSEQDLELVAINDADLFNDDITSSQLNKNPIIISWYSSSSINETSSGCLAVLKFKILNNAKDSDVNITYDEENVFDINFKNVQFNTISGSVVVNETTPTVKPPVTPTVEPAATPTVTPTVEPTVTPTVEPTAIPTIETTINADTNNTIINDNINKEEIIHIIEPVKKKIKISNIKFGKTKITGKLSVSKATVKIKVGKKGWKKAKIKGKKFTLKNIRVKKNVKIKIKVVKKGYVTLNKRYLPE